MVLEIFVVLNQSKCSISQKKIYHSAESPRIGHTTRHPRKRKIDDSVDETERRPLSRAGRLLMCAQTRLAVSATCPCWRCTDDDLADRLGLRTGPAPACTELANSQHRDVWCGHGVGQQDLRGSD